MGFSHATSCHVMSCHVISSCDMISHGVMHGIVSCDMMRVCNALICYVASCDVSMSDSLIERERASIQHLRQKYEQLRHQQQQTTWGTTSTQHHIRTCHSTLKQSTGISPACLPGPIDTSSNKISTYRQLMELVKQMACRLRPSVVTSCSMLWAGSTWEHWSYFFLSFKCNTIWIEQLSTEMKQIKIAIT